MPRNVTVTFSDGTGHSYENAPDDITPDQVAERISKEFPDKEIKNVDGGKSAPVAAPAPAPVKKSVGDYLSGVADRAGAELHNAGANAKALISDLAGVVPKPPSGKQVVSDLLTQGPQKIATQAVGAGPVGLAATAAGGYRGAANAALEGPAAGAQAVQSTQALAPRPSSPTADYAGRVLAMPLEAAKVVGKHALGSWGRVLGNEAAGETIGEALPEAGAALALRTSPTGKTKLSHIEQARADMMANGYKLPPVSNPSGMNSTITTVGKKEVIDNHITKDNQENSNRLAKKELGISQDQKLDASTFDALRDKLAAPYEKIKNLPFSIKVPQQFKDKVNMLQDTAKMIQQSFPEFQLNSETSRAQNLAVNTAPAVTPKAVIELAKSLRDEARADMRNPTAKAADKRAAKEKMEIADSLEQLLDHGVRQYVKTVKNSQVSPNLVRDLQVARREIAKTHDVQDTVNQATGDIDAAALARKYKKGTPLTGGLKSIADAHDTASNVVRNTDGLDRKEQFSVSDMGMTAAGGLAAAVASHGALLPAAAGAVAASARPAASALATSRLYQNAAVKPKVKNEYKNGKVRKSAAIILGDDEENKPWRKQ